MKLNLEVKVVNAKFLLVNNLIFEQMRNQCALEFPPVNFPHDGHVQNKQYL